MVNTYLRWRRRRWNGEVATGRLPELQAYGDVFAQVDARQALIAALDRLPARQRAVVVLRYFADQTESQTAAAMGCSVGTVKAHASKALARLRDAPGLAELHGGRCVVVNTEEHQLADMLRRVAPEPPRRVTVEDVAFRLANQAAESPRRRHRDPAPSAAPGASAVPGAGAGRRCWPRPACSWWPAPARAWPR
jgi:DNA-binding CsgD family transcriptional regulator